MFFLSNDHYDYKEKELQMPSHGGIKLLEVMQQHTSSLIFHTIFGEFDMRKIFQRQNE